MNLFFQQTALSKIAIAEQNDRICGLYFANDIIPADAEQIETALIHEAFLQLNAYFTGHLKTFSLPLAPEGTAFMQQVWQALQTIPYGTTASYKDIALAIGNVKAVRAVGLANYKNPIPIFIPCHRVIGSNGKLTGYSSGLIIKKFLLSLEQRGTQND